MSETETVSNVLTCSYCGKTYPADRKSAFYQHVRRHVLAQKRAEERAKKEGKSLTIARGLSVPPSGAVSPEPSAVRVDSVPAPQVGAEEKPAGLTEIPPVGGAVESPEGGMGEKGPHIGLSNFGAIIGALYGSLLGRAGFETLSRDELGEIERAFEDETLNIPASPRAAALANVASALAAPLARRAPALIEKFKNRNKPKVKAEPPAVSWPPAAAAGDSMAGTVPRAPAEPLAPPAADETGGPVGADTGYHGGTSPYPPTEPDFHTLTGTPTYEEELRAAQARYQKIMESLHKDKTD